MKFQNVKKIKDGYVEINLPLSDTLQMHILADRADPVPDTTYYRNNKKIYRWGKDAVRDRPAVDLEILISTKLSDLGYVLKMLRRHFNYSRGKYLLDKFDTKQPIPTSVDAMVSTSEDVIYNVALFNYVGAQNPPQLVQAYEWLVKTNPDEYSNYMYLSMCLARMGEFDRSEGYMVKATELSGTNRQSISYAWANFYALSGEYDEAIKILLKMSNEGWLARFPLMQDPDLKALHDHPKWDKIYRRAN